MNDEQPIAKPPMKLSEFKTELVRLRTAKDEAEREFNRASDLYGQFLHDNLGVAPGQPATLESTIEFIEKVTAMKEQEKC